MRKLLIIVTAVLCIAFVVDSCKKTGGNINPLSSVSNNGIGSYLVLDKTNSLNLDYNTIATSAVGIDVHGYKGGEAVDHIILYASNGSAFDTTQWHLIKSVPYASPTTLSVTGAEIASALGVDISTLVPGSSYTVFTRAVTKTGKTYDASNTGDNSGGGLITGLAYNTAFFFTATVICAYDASTATGKYKIVQDDWTTGLIGNNDIGSLVTVTALANDTLDLSGALPDAQSITDGGSINKHLVIVVDPATGVATVPTDSKGNGIDFAKYNYFGGFDGVATGSGYVFSCTGEITITFDIIATGFGDQGNFTLTLQKQ